ncbi:MAG TPA: ABC transporter permease [Phycisphaerales bacterium]|nr:ABC transporter permease [Phycisphaerales bacterium]
MFLIRLGFQTVVLALSQVWANKVRSLLTTLGIIIGVAAVIATVAATNGLKQWVLSEFETFGAKKVFISGHVPMNLRGQQGIRQRVRLTVAEVRAIQEGAESIEMITPMMFGSHEIDTMRGVRQTLLVTGIWPSWHTIEDRYVTSGRPFSSLDEENVASVCLVNDKAIEEMGLPRDPVNEIVLIGGRRFLIVGVVETKQLAAMFPGGGEAQTEVFIPLAAARSFDPEARVSFALAQLVSTDLAAEAQAEIKFILRRLRKLGPNDPETYEVEVLQQIIDQFTRIANGITAGAGGIVAISLLVGGIGIMNIMLVSVSERTREIGLRKAVGARPEVVLLQFLVEAVTLCLVGGLLGLAVGHAITLGLASIPNSPLKDGAVPAWAVLLGVSFSAVTGIVFGMFPALKAARLDPIVALRHE